MTTYVFSLRHDERGRCLLYPIDLEDDAAACLTAKGCRGVVRVEDLDGRVVWDAHSDGVSRPGARGPVAEACP